MVLIYLKESMSQEMCAKDSKHTFDVDGSGVCKETSDGSSLTRTITSTSFAFPLSLRLGLPFAVVATGSKAVGDEVERENVDGWSTITTSGSESTSIAWSAGTLLTLSSVVEDTVAEAVASFWWRAEARCARPVADLDIVV